MNQTALKGLSSFGESAVALDRDFIELETLGGQIERLELESDHDFERAKKILARFEDGGRRIGEGVQSMARNLEEVRSRAEKAAAIVAERAVAVAARQQRIDELLGRYEGLAQTLASVLATVSQLQKAKGDLNPEARALLVQSLPEINNRLGLLSEEAARLKSDAREARMTTLERNSDSLSQSLRSIRDRLERVAQE